MGATASLQEHFVVEAVMPEPVTLNIYNVGTSSEVQAINKILRVLGTGAFHCGVEVYGVEWSYRGNIPGLPGVFSRRPRDCEGHTYSESVFMGMTLMCRSNVEDTIAVLTGEWPGTKYDVLKFNCCHFCDKFCNILGVGPIPDWITNLASTGAAILDAGDYLGARTVSFGDKVDRAVCGPAMMVGTQQVACANCLCAQTASRQTYVVEVM
eukprot:CAMPEP_0171059460 /NCGR_PEP_ID=MMETSP0766_2-20121228/3187_1 /TAXON_ID=439317 /ORGANISM="Gambierdiscus australes, Strain CAWD 149" /LENGTH=209 /DNA_ID=CAMNT_0011514897 /DNA_START=30 /DNA_END=659 /DNA_ORIENTATION=+